MFYQGLISGIIVGFTMGLVFAAVIVIRNDRHRKRLEAEMIQARGK